MNNEKALTGMLPVQGFVLAWAEGACAVGVSRKGVISCFSYGVAVSRTISHLSPSRCSSSVLRVLSL